MIFEARRPGRVVTACCVVAGCAALGAVIPSASGDDPAQTAQFLDAEPLYFPTTVVGRTTFALEDLDGDHVVDLAYAEYTGAMRYLRGLGGGLFDTIPQVIGPGQSMSTVFPPFCADVDGDGDNDVVAAGDGSRTTGVIRRARVHVNDGAGGFSTVLDVDTAATAPATSQVAAIDLGGDGDLDFVVPDYLSREVLVFRNDAGTFVEQQRLAPDEDNAPGHTFIAGDVNGDGRDDLLIASSSGSAEHLGVAVQAADGTLGTVVWFGAPSVLTGAPSRYFAVPSDFDADGDLDVLVRRFIARNDGNGTFTFDAQAELTDPGLYAFTDLNNDGRVDAFRVDGSDTLHVRPGALAGFGPDESYPAHVPLPEGATLVTDLFSGDVDDDGRPDLVFGTQFDGGVTLLRQTGTPAPVASGVEPGVIREAGVQTLRITGLRFLEGVAAESSTGTTIDAVTFLDSTSIEVTASFSEAAGSGTQALALRNPDGQRALVAVRLESLALDVTRGRVKDARLPARDVLVVSGHLTRTTLSASDAESSLDDLVRDGMRLTLGHGADTLVVDLPADDAHWKRRGKGGHARIVWRSARDEFPRRRLVVRGRDGAFRLRQSLFDHPALDTGAPTPLRVTATTGDDVGTADTAWTPARRRTFRLATR